MTYAPLKTDYAGDKSAMFWLALKTGLLTVLTLGIYRFWMKTRLRRYYWSAIRPGGAPLEYVGEPLEKLLGFLTAVVFMAFYIGIVNLILMFFSFTLFQTNATAYAVSFVGVLPIIFFAQYRARRYILARTRWRGIRFGLEPGAWGYAWRAAIWWLVTILSAGLLWPLKAYKLEKYRTDRTLYGTARFHQGGSWTMLLGPMRHLYIPAALSGAAAGLAWWSDDGQWLLVLILTVPWSYFGVTYWMANSFRRLTETKELDGVGFNAQPRAGRILGIYVGGYLLASLAISGVIWGLALIILGVTAGGLVDFESALEGDLMTMPTWVSALIGIAAYFTVFLMWSVFIHVFITLPLARHYAETLEVTGAEYLPVIRQRDRDEFAEAEGFADALDVGAAL